MHGNMGSKIVFSIEDASRDLAEQYAKGKITIDEYMDVFTSICESDYHTKCKNAKKGF